MRNLSIFQNNFESIYKFVYPFGLRSIMSRFTNQIYKGSRNSWLHNFDHRSQQHLHDKLLAYLYLRHLQFQEKLLQGYLNGVGLTITIFQSIYILEFIGILESQKLAQTLSKLKMNCSFNTVHRMSIGRQSCRLIVYVRLISCSSVMHATFYELGFRI